jgi:RNA polymerase sigma-70 factor (ECF subfamily)
VDESALICDAQKGDLEAFNHLVLAYQQLVYNVAYRVMGDPAAAEDATQEAFISAYRSMSRFRGGSFRAWLLRIVTNACYDELRRRKRKPSSSLEALTTDTSEPTIADASDLHAIPIKPDAAAERAELARAIQDCLNLLPEDFRTVAVLVDIQGYDYQEVATVIRKPLGTVKSRVARARARMRECLQRYRELLPSTYRLEDEAVP